MLRWYISGLAGLIVFSCSPKIAEKAAPESELPQPIASAYVIKETVNLRNTANTQSPVIKQLKDGEKIQIFRNRDGWYEIRDANQQAGWLRSDLVGPRALSRTALAAAFVDSILPAFRSTMYFDNEKRYQKVYIILPPEYYRSEDSAREQALKIARSYQERVYPGQLDIVVLKEDRENLFVRSSLPAIGRAEIPVPILSLGRLITLQEENGQITIGLALRSDASNDELLHLARQTAHTYDESFSKVEVFIVKDVAERLQYLREMSQKPSDAGICLLYFREDKDGEFYRFQFCK
jgi:hypothetical protein